MEGRGEKVKGQTHLSINHASTLYSDILVQIVDARNPLLFRCEDLVQTCMHLLVHVVMCLSLQEKYAQELDSNKVNMLLISKADLLSPEQRFVIWKPSPLGGGECCPYDLVLHVQAGLG